mgnify:CR=1 FL=1
MSAERSKGNSAFLLTDYQKKEFVDKMVDGWNGKNSLPLNAEILEQLVQMFSPKAEVEKVIEALKGNKNQ